MSIIDQVKRVTIFGIIGNILLSILKIISGKFSGSISLVADGIHSISDLFTDFLVFVGSHFSDIPPDENHPYGHGKIETMVAIIIALVLISVGAGIFWQSYIGIESNEKDIIELPIIIIALLSISIKEYLFRKTRKVAHNTNSPALYANAWHHRSDALSSIAVLIGGIAIMAGWPLGDSVAGVIVGVMIVFSGIKVIMDSSSQLCEHAIDKGSLNRIKAVLNKCDKIVSWTNLRTRSAGREFFIDLILKVDADMTVEQAHDITVDVENRIQNLFPNPVNIIIHIEPVN